MMIIKLPCACADAVAVSEKLTLTRYVPQRGSKDTGC